MRLPASRLPAPDGRSGPSKRRRFTAEHVRRARTALALAAAALGCSGAGHANGDVVVADSAGVALYTVAGVPADTVFVAEPAVVLGSAALNAASSETFELISDVAVTADGSVVVVDNRAGRVALFAPAGDWERDVGGRGRGPGEFVAPLWVDAARDSLFVWDVQSRRLTAFGPDGELAASRSIPARSSPGRIVVAGASLVDEVEWGQLYDPRPAAGAIVRRTRSGVVLDTLFGPYPVPEYGWEVSDERTGAGHMTNPPALAVGPAWTVDGERLYVLFPGRSSVVAVSVRDGALLERWSLPSRGHPLRSGDRRRFAAAVANRFGGEADRVEARTEFADTVPAYAGLVVDDRHRLWVSDHDAAARP